MKQILYIICSLFLLSTISSISLALPECPSSGYRSNCFGTYKWISGEFEGYTYTGEWMDNIMHGFGISGYPNGDKYIGEYKDGRPWNAKGYDKDSKIIAKWVNGVKKE